MARFPRSGFSSLSFPSFTGVTSQLVLANVAVFFVLLLMKYAAVGMLLVVLQYFSLTPALLIHGWVWQLATYSFLNSGVLHVAFNMLTLWFIGSFLETSKGSRWLLEIYFLCAIGGGLIGSALTFTHIFHSDPVSSTTSADGALFGLLAAFAVLFGDLEMYMFPLPVAIKAKYLVIVYMLIEVALLLEVGGRSGCGLVRLDGGSTVASQLEEVSADGVEATVGVDPGIGPKTLDQFEAGPRPGDHADGDGVVERDDRAVV